MAFIVNGAEWAFNGITVADAQARIERALDFIGTSMERREVVAVGEDFQTRPMCGTESLWELFHKDSALALPPELSRELEAWLMDEVKAGRALPGLYPPNEETMARYKARNKS